MSMHTKLADTLRALHGKTIEQITVLIGKLSDNDTVKFIRTFEAEGRGEPQIVFALSRGEFNDVLLHITKGRKTIIESICKHNAYTAMIILEKLESGQGYGFEIIKPEKRKK